MKQRQAVTKKKALTYRGADRAGRSRRPQPRWYSFTDGLPEQVLPGRDNRADLGKADTIRLAHRCCSGTLPLASRCPWKRSLLLNIGDWTSVVAC